MHPMRPMPSPERSTPLHVPAARRLVPPRGRRAVAAAALASAALALVACAQLPSTERKLAAAVRSRPVVLLGEVHDNADQHALRAAALRELVSGGARPVLAMEQFDRERQADVDRALDQPGAGADDVIAAAAPADAGWDWRFYRPFIALAIEYRLPIVAANVSRADTRRALQGGLAALGFDAAVPTDIADAQAGDIEASHCGAIDTATARRMVGAQAARDQFMARVVAAHADRGVVLLAGNGHVRADVGVPRWLPPAVRAKSVAIGLIEAGTMPPGAFDLVFDTPAQPRPDPCVAFGQPPAG